MATDCRQKAREFRDYWKSQRGSERSEGQHFWNMLLRDVLGMDNVEQRTQPQVPVQMEDTTKVLDFWIPETKVLIEHKKRGVKLDAPQSGHGGKTPFEQASEYNQARGYSDKARWIVTCNFDEIWCTTWIGPAPSLRRYGSPIFRGRYTALISSWTLR